MRGLIMDTPLLLSDLIDYAADHHGATEIVARTIEGDLHRYTYADARRRCKRLAKTLIRLGVTPGTRVASLAWNTHRHFEMFYGVTGMGAVLHTVNPRLFPEQLVYIINHGDEHPAWLSGVVFGPQVRVSLAALRELVPQQYPIRHYPDITHSRQCQYPVPDWDVAYAVTEARECINPRPRDEAAIFRATWPQSIGFITYSEGCNDDVNKAVWSALGWDPEADVVQVLREYSRYFIGDTVADDFAQGLLALEQDWRGPLLANATVETTLQQFQAMERAAAPRQLKNWRFQQGLFRAYYDAYTRRRLIYETDLEKQALERLRQASNTGALSAMADAERILNRSLTETPAADWPR